MSDEFRFTVGPHSNRGHDGHAEFRGEPFDVEPEAALRGEIAHVQRDDHRQRELFEVEHEPQVCRVDDADDVLRRLLAREPAEELIARDRFVERGRGQAVGARQIGHVEATPVRPADERAFLALDGDARVVRDFLAAAGEPVEQRRLAAVRHPDQRDAQGRRRMRAGTHRCRSVGVGDAHEDRCGFASAHGKCRGADAHRNRIATGPDFSDHLDGFARYETELEQATANGRLRFVAELLLVLANRQHDAARPLAQLRKAHGGFGRVRVHGPDPESRLNENQLQLEAPPTANRGGFVVFT